MSSRKRGLLQNQQKEKSRNGGSPDILMNDSYSQHFKIRGDYIFENNFPGSISLSTKPGANVPARVVYSPEFHHSYGKFSDSYLYAMVGGNKYLISDNPRSHLPGFLDANVVGSLSEIVNSDDLEGEEVLAFKELIQGAQDSFPRKASHYLTL